MHSITSIATATAAFALAASVAIAASHNTPEAAAANARKAHMDLYSHNLGILGAMAKGSVDYDMDAATGAADNLAALAVMDQSSYWLPNSSNADMENTRALPAIWENGADVGAKATALVEATMAMKEAAGSLDGVRASIGDVGKACGACHKAYRAPDN